MYGDGGAGAIGGGAAGDEDARAACIHGGALRRRDGVDSTGRGAAADKSGRGEGGPGRAGESAFEAWRLGLKVRREHGSGMVSLFR